MSLNKKITLLFTAIALMAALPVQAARAENFSQWVQNFKKQATAQGISPQFYDNTFVGMIPEPRVVELDKKQPERKNIGFQTYLSNVMTQKRIDDGRAGALNYKGVLHRVENTYQVPPEVVVALWGLETSYGKNTGGFDVIRSLATLAWEGRRAEFFRKELIEALKILQDGHISRKSFKGSWAGAMGQNQFMPSSWGRYAVDFNGDGHRDIWNTKEDVFASSANYLHRNGWSPSLKWGWRIVHAPKNYNKKTMNYSEWLKLSVKFEGIAPHLPPNTNLTLIVPDGGGERMYLVTKNFDVIKTWNRSDYFALSVGLLSDFVAKGTQTPSPNLQQRYVNP